MITMDKQGRRERIGERKKYRLGWMKRNETKNECKEMNTTVQDGGRGEREGGERD